ncbi:MAG: 8-amino-7-oxononanoate synthase [Egibacteraceae bacterium]
MGDPLGWIGTALRELETAGLRRALRHRTTGAGPLVDGLVNLSSNDYLGLAGDPRVVEAARDAAGTWGAGAGASRLVTGGTELHRELERAIARWKRTEDAVVFSSGYLANAGTIPALVGRDDAVFSDALNHASIIDGCRLSRAQVHVYPHRDVAALDRLLAATERTARRRLVVTDGVFSMGGDAADLVGLCAVAEAHGAMVIVDDAHGCGVLGPYGRGTAAAQGCAGRVGVQLGTLSKAFGAAGGYVAGAMTLCDWLRNRARGFIFDTAPAPAVVGAALRALEIAAAEPWRRATALRLARRLADGLGATEPAACVVPLVLGEPEPALRASAALAEAGLLVVPIRPPTVPPGTARLRFAISAAHTEAEIDRAVRCVLDLGGTAPRSSVQTAR